MRTTRSRLLGLSAALAVASLALGACAAQPGGETGGGSIEEIVFAVPSLPTSLDNESFFESNVVTYTVRNSILTGLIRYKYVENPADPTAWIQDFNQFEGVLADPELPYEISDDGLTYTFHLREGVVSQAGNPFTAEDVRWSFERKCVGAVNPNVCFANQNPWFSSHEQVEVIDDYTVAFHLNVATPANTFLPFLAGSGGWLYDKEAMLEHATADDPWAKEWAVLNSGWGYGAYEIESITPDQQLVLVANPDYVLGEPAVKKVTLQVVGTSGQRAQLVAAGNAHIAEGLTAEDQNAIAGDDNVELAVVGAPIEFAYLVLVQEQEPFDDKLVRQAFRYAVPYQKLIDQVWGGRAIPAVGWITENMGVQGLSSEPAYDTDLELARELLDQAGIDEVEVTMHVSSAQPELINAAILIASELEQVGFIVNVEQHGAGDFASARNERVYQAFLALNRSQIQTPYNLKVNFYNPLNPTQAQGGFPGSPELDALNEEALAIGPFTVPEATEVWQKTQDFYNDEASQLPMLYTQPVQAYSSLLKGFTYRYDNSIDLSALVAR